MERMPRSVQILREYMVVYGYRGVLEAAAVAVTVAVRGTAGLLRLIVSCLNLS
jgi:hypothetical protein